MMQKVNHEIQRLSNRSADEFNKIRAELDKHIIVLTAKVEDIGRKKADNVVEFCDIVKHMSCVVRITTSARYGCIFHCVASCHLN